MKNTCKCKEDDVICPHKECEFKGSEVCKTRKALLAVYKQTKPNKA